MTFGRLLRMMISVLLAGLILAGISMELGHGNLTVQKASRLFVKPFSPDRPAEAGRLRIRYQPITFRSVPATAQTVSPVACLSFNASGPVDIGDIMAVVAHWGQQSTDPGWDGRFDLDGDGDTDIDDVQLAASAWRHTCPPPGLPPAQIACLSFNASGPVDIGDIMAVVAHWGQQHTNPGWDGRFDLDSDGDTDIDDVQLAAGAWRHSCIPPDPAAVAPEVNPGEATSLQGATEFLYTGENPIQTGVVTGTIQAQRVAVLRGKVLTRAGQPLSGVAITVLDHREYGQTLSREDGMFDLAVNGGAMLTVVYRKDGYLPAQRQMDVPWQDYVWLPDVTLSPRDSQVTTVDLTSSEPMQVARGSVVTDADGTRQATLFFPQGTQAEVVLSDGSTAPVNTLNVRLTEYTVGANGPQAMPAPLPPTSGYTYAVELSADEAVAKVNGKDVVFDQPVIFYVDNFLGFPTGTGVPTGYYDNDRGVWVPVEDGRVIPIVHGRAMFGGSS